ncbi:sensor histidine kinase [Lentilactobacillus laojiaonis]|uniref:sensor histidine kinase n=1 Tax=Lentilactobacillus laojiaonis TaxID=2883998 RepID=UPI001D0AE775|nr:HAMP domain-containing sensor histidine kinase [Lentilactobacillus laojiaonis]UDM32028.1 HAMP domain-containing histidine kinase [Lentilactobacillus laojiaonis]
MKLTGKERTELVLEGIFTFVLLILLNLSIIILFNQMVAANPGIRDGIFIIRYSIGGVHFPMGTGLRQALLAAMLVIDIIVVIWRLIRRYNQYQLHHIIDELHYIANGHLEHRINFGAKTSSNSVKNVAESINALVDSVIKTMNDERKIEHSKDELITNVSHDLRTPLTSILGYLGLIQDKQYNSEADLVKYANIAYLKAKQMKSLVDNLFEFTKVRQTSTKLTINKLDLNQMLEQLVASFELEAKKYDIEITALDTDHPFVIEADAEKLGRVFNNLISNALKYARDGKLVTLKASQVNDNEIIIDVSNDGPQIPEKALNQIFERFYRVEESRNKDTGGTGLGLAIAQSIIQLHGGYISVTSDEDLTTFSVHLPAKPNEKLSYNEEL